MYTETVLDHFHNPRNMGELEGADAVSQIGNPVCGDIIKFYLKVGHRVGESGDQEEYIEDIKFQTMGCAAAISVSSLMTELVKGKPLEEAAAVDFNTIVEKLGGLPPVKLHCAQLAEECLKNAIKSYQEGL